MLYTRRTFTLPSGGGKVTERKWDYSIMSKTEFLTKYGADAPEYAEDIPVAQVEFHTSNVPATLPEHSGSVLIVTQ